MPAGGDNVTKDEGQNGGLSSSPTGRNDASRYDKVARLSLQDTGFLLKSELER